MYQNAYILSLFRDLECWIFHIVVMQLHNYAVVIMLVKLGLYILLAHFVSWLLKLF